MTNPAGSESAVAGLAIATTKVGSISGQKWNDENGNQIFDASEDGLPGWTIYLDLNNNGQLDLKRPLPTRRFTQASTDIPQTIPDQNLVGVKSSLDFTGVGIIEDVNVTLDISHTYDADVHVSLISPSGTRVKLFANVGGSGDNFHNTVLDDRRSLPIRSLGTLLSRAVSVRRSRLSAFDGEDALGDWKLEVIDDTSLAISACSIAGPSRSS